MPSLTQDSINKQRFEKKLLTRFAQRKLQNDYISIKSLEELNGEYYMRILCQLLGKCEKHDDSQKIRKIAENRPTLAKALKQVEHYLPAKVALPTASEIEVSPDEHFSVLSALFSNLERFDNFPGPTAEKSLLAWVNSLIPSDIYAKISVNNFTDSWRNGMALCALIHQFNPKCIRFEKLSAKDVEANIRLCVYASNILLNFGDLLDYKDYTSASELAMTLLISEYYEAFKHSKRVNASKETISIAAEELENLETRETELTKLEKDFETLLNKNREDLTKNTRDAVNMKLNAENTKRALERIDSRADSTSQLIALEDHRIANFLAAVRINSQPAMAKLSAQRDSPEHIEEFERLKKLRCALENDLQFEENGQHVALQVDDNHAQIASETILWAKDMRERIAKAPVSASLKEIFNEINCHRALNLEISSKQCYTRSELSKHENFLKTHSFKDISRTLNRVSLPEMFGVLNKEWLAKLALLRDIEEKIKADFYVQQLYGEHKQILKEIKLREKIFFETFCGDMVVEDCMSVKRKVYRLTHEKSSNELMLTRDMKRMLSLEKRIKEESLKGMKTKKLEKSYFDSIKERLEEITERRKTRYDEASKKLSDLVVRELFKEKVRTMCEAHKDRSDELKKWIGDENQKIDDLNEDFSNIGEAQEQLLKIKLCQSQLQYDTDTKLNYLRSIGDRIKNSDFASARFPSHRWRFNSDNAKDDSLDRRLEELLVAMAALSAKCDAKRRALERAIEALRERDDQRISFAAVAEQFKRFAEDGARKAQRSLLSRRSAPEDLSEFEASRKDEMTSLLIGSRALLNDAEKKYEICSQAGAIKDIDDQIIQELIQVQMNFESVLAASQKKFNAEANKLRKKDELCREYANTVEEVIGKLKKDRAELLEFDPSDTAMKEKIKTTLELNEELVNGVSAMENDLLGKEIVFNPHTAYKHSDVKSWADFLSANLQLKLTLIERLGTFARLSSLPLCTLKTQHQSFSKHSDVANCCFLDKAAFADCAASLGAALTAKETDALFDRLGVKSKKNPEVRLLGEERFLEFCRSLGSERSGESVLASFACLNNGLPFVTKEQLATKLSLGAVNFVERAVGRFEKAVPRDLYFARWVRGAYFGPSFGDNCGGGESHSAQEDNEVKG